MIQLKKLLTLALILFFTSSTLAGCLPGTGGGQLPENRVIIGGKNFTEQDVLVHIMATLIEENSDIVAERRGYLGGTNVVHEAIRTGSIDMYAEYTGTGWTVVLGEEAIGDPDQVYDGVQEGYENQFNIRWLTPLGFENTYGLTMRPDQAAQLGVTRISDLQEHAPNLVFGCTHEFLERPDGYGRMNEYYGLNFRSVTGMDPGLTYAAVRDGAVDVIDGFTTDGRIPAFNLVVLEDDRAFFPPYYAVPIVRQETLDRLPQLEEILTRLGGRLTNEEMARLNAMVDLERMRAETVARMWLEEEGLIP
ncbi:ABC transporter substrate-binding protein [Heliorestis convoluta]|uniref:Substrate binding domain of ABC-type glycine betaine transport system family protein n=1 Tax=Heliorestis convoluta TaxID=356322 RepID=A0A5Q2N2E0_9FIRM|nr:glycine betaine ABC transporter substrate-binding protein [Heliorestis convoluta]QGG48997.1 substrate binding domain of ABC-type glycine betaine transport system family protein [Heliorestis convoluta]